MCIVATSRGEVSQVQRDGTVFEDSEPRGAINEERWWAIVDAAFEIFVQKGYRDATVQDVAKRVGLLKGSLYYYIKSKEDLLYAIIERSHLQAKANLLNTPGLTNGSPVERVRRFIEVWTDNVESQPEAARLSSLETRYLSRESQHKLRVLEKEIEAMMAEIVEEGVVQGVFDSDVDTRLAVFTIFHLLHHPRARAVDAESMKRIREWNTVFILRGLGAEV